MPNSPRNADQEYLQGPRIPGALRFNLDKVAEHDKAKNPLGLTHMLPSAETFREAVGESLPVFPLPPSDLVRFTLSSLSSVFCSCRYQGKPRQEMPVARHE